MCVWVCVDGERATPDLWQSWSRWGGVVKITAVKVDELGLTCFFVSGGPVHYVNVKHSVEKIPFKGLFQVLRPELVLFVFQKAQWVFLKLICFSFVATGTSILPREGLFPVCTIINYHIHYHIHHELKSRVLHLREDQMIHASLPCLCLDT